MVDRDLVLAKVETLERSLARIDTARGAPGSTRSIVRTSSC